MNDTFIGIDLGTSGCRACLIDTDEQILAETRVAFPEPVINNECAEQDAAIWWQAVQQVLTDLARHPQASFLKAISVDGTSSTVLVTDDDYHPLAPALMYNDSRASEEAKYINQIVPHSASAVHGASSSLSKSLWLLKRHPESKHILHQADFITGRLCGNYASDLNNCLKLGFDPETEHWPEWIKQLGISLSLLPEANPPGSVAGELKREIQKLFHSSDPIKVISGTTDSIAGFLATGANQPGDAVVSIGSTIAIKVLSNKPLNSAKEGIYSHKINNMWLVGGASNAGTTVLRHLFTDKELQRLTEKLNFDQPTGLKYYPIPKPGERFPLYDPKLTPVLTPEPDNKVLFLQAILESLTEIEKQCYLVLEQKGVSKIKRLFTIGGAIKNNHWMRYRETQLQYSTEHPAHIEACFGTALLAKQGYDQH